MIKSSYLIKGQRKFILVVKSQSKYLAGQHFDRGQRSEYRIYRSVTPLILFLSYNGGFYPLYYSSHTMEGFTLYIILSYNGGHYPLYYSSHTMEDITLYIIPLIQWRILPSILFLSYNGGYYPLYYSSHTMEDITLYIIPLIQWRILPSIPAPHTMEGISALTSSNPLNTSSNYV